MIRLQMIIILGVLAVTSLNAVAFQQKYVGRSDCEPELKRGPGTYGIRLDKRQNARLVAHTVNGKNVLLIVQYKDENDQCGTIRDSVQARRAGDSFEFDCINSHLPSEVTVGTRSRNDVHVSGVAVESWHVDLKELKFVADQGRVVCVRRSNSGNDQGEDLVSLAKERASKKQDVPKR